MCPLVMDEHLKEFWAEAVCAAFRLVSLGFPLPVPFLKAIEKLLQQALNDFTDTPLLEDGLEF